MTNTANYGLNQQARRVLYALKRQYGGFIDIYKLVSSETDARTGVRTATASVTHIYRAIILPGHTARKAVRGISLISANKELVAGGTYDSNSRDFIVDRVDAPGLTALTSDDWIVYQGRKYQVSEVQAFEFDSGWIITAKELVGEVPQASIVATAGSLVDLSSDAGVE